MKALQLATTSCNPLQHLEKEILVYQQLPIAAEDDPAIAGDCYSRQCPRYNGLRKAQPISCDFGRNFKRGYKKRIKRGEKNNGIG